MFLSYSEGTPTPLALYVLVIKMKRKTKQKETVCMFHELEKTPGRWNGDFQYNLLLWISCNFCPMESLRYSGVHIALHSSTNDLSASIHREMIRAMYSADQTSSSCLSLRSPPTSLLLLMVTTILLFLTIVITTAAIIQMCIATSFAFLLLKGHFFIDLIRVEDHEYLPKYIWFLSFIIMPPKEIFGNWITAQNKQANKQTVCLSSIRYQNQLEIY